MGFLRHLPSFLVLSTALVWVDGALAQDPSKFALTGVITKEDGTSVAWIGEPTLTQGRPLLVREGDQLGTYRVAKIREDRVELDGPAGKVIVRLYASAVSGGPAVSAPGSAPATAAVPAAEPQGQQRQPPPGLAPGKETRAYLDAVTDPRIRNSKGFRSMIGE